MRFEVGFGSLYLHIRAKDGDNLIEKEDILKNWSEYITEVYHDDRDPSPIISNGEVTPPPLEEEVPNALKKMKKGMAE